jgi:hypothetical protein
MAAFGRPHIHHSSDEESAMAVLMVYDATGDPKTLLNSYHKAGQELKGQLPAGMLAHICVPTTTGFRTYAVMESEQHARQAFEAQTFKGNKGSGRDVVHRHGLVTQHRAVQMMPVFAFSVAQNVHDMQARLASERNGGGGSGPAGSQRVALGEEESRA